MSFNEHKSLFDFPSTKGHLRQTIIRCGIEKSFRFQFPIGMLEIFLTNYVA